MNKEHVWIPCHVCGGEGHIYEENLRGELDQYICYECGGNGGGWLTVNEDKNEIQNSL